MQNRIELLKMKLQELKRRDTKFMVFGSKSHRYNSFIVTESEVAEFENDYGIRLPEEFREFLFEIGYGAGPNYGIYSFEKIRKELCDISEIFSKETKLNQHFKFSNKDTKNYIELKSNGVQGYYYKILSGLEGWMPVCHHGCTYYSILIISGEQSGKVWDMCEDGYQILPAGVIKDFSFYDWYENWLDEQLSMEFQDDDIYRLLDSNPEKIKRIIGPKLETVPLKKILKCKNLESLSLTFNSLVTLPRVNKKTWLPSVISKPISRGIDELKSLKMLFLSNNLLTELPPEISSLENLVHLDISKNQISEIPTDTPFPKTLKSLKMSGNKLTKIPIGLFPLTTLESLEVQENAIPYIPEDYHFPKSLKSINLSNNQLSSLPATLQDLNELRSIDISNNKFGKVPECIKRINCLRSLMLAGNNLKDFSGIQYLYTAMRISLNHCDLQSFPEELLSLKDLRMLDIADNSIEKLPEKMNNLEGVIWLNLNQNIFVDFENTIEILSTMPNLRDLSISYQTLSEIPRNISKLCFLDALCLQTSLDNDAHRRSITREERDEQELRLLKMLPNTSISFD